MRLRSGWPCCRTERSERVRGRIRNQASLSADAPVSPDRCSKRQQAAPHGSAASQKLPARTSITSVTTAPRNPISWARANSGSPAVLVKHWSPPRAALSHPHAPGVRRHWQRLAPSVRMRSIARHRSNRVAPGTDGPVRRRCGRLPGERCDARLSLRPFHDPKRERVKM